LQIPHLFFSFVLREPRLIYEEVDSLCVVVIGEERAYVALMMLFVFTAIQGVGQKERQLSGA
jgi:hypothetical protein